jgi:3'(2'), 5'-bisphosphate nucleotidase
MGDPQVSDSDSVLARVLADEAGDLLLRLRKDAGSEPEDVTSLRASGDAGANDLLLRRLAQERPDDAVLSEEAQDDRVRLRARRVWIVDPLDGTREFGEPPRDDWAVHVALWQDGDLTAGAVARPAAGTTYATDDPPKAPTGEPQRIRLAVSRSRPPAFVTALADRLGAELVPMGSAGVKASSVWDGSSDAYLHAGGQYEWDSAAPVAVARAAGLHTSRIDGSPLAYNRPDPLLPDLLICRPEIAERLLVAIADLTTEETGT